MLTRSFNKNTIHNLPDELLIIILGFLNTFEWNKCKRISKRWHYICNIGMVKRKYRERNLLEKPLKILKWNKVWKNKVDFDIETNDFVYYNENKKILNLHRDYPYNKNVKKFYVTDRVYNIFIRNKKVYMISQYRIIIWDYINSSFEEFSVNRSYGITILITNDGKLLAANYYEKKEIYYLNNKKKLKFKSDIGAISFGKKDTVFAVDESGYVGILNSSRIKKIKVFDNLEMEWATISSNESNYFCVSNFDDFKLYNDNNILINTFNLETDDMVQIVLNDKINIFDYSNENILIYNMKGKLINKFKIDAVRIERGPYNSLIYETSYNYGNKSDFYLL
jgi:hypothetical protein